MVKIPVVTDATIKMIQPNELKVGDSVLFMNRSAKVLEIEGEFITLNINLEDPTAIIHIPRYSIFYHIIDCKIQHMET